MLCLSVGTKIFNPLIHCQIDVYGEVTQCINYGVTTLRKLACPFLAFHTERLLLTHLGQVYATELYWYNHVTQG